MDMTDYQIYRRITEFIILAIRLG